MIRRKANARENNGEQGHFLDIFGLAAPSKKILLDIINHGTSSVAELSSRLNMPKSTIYDGVTPLLAESLINEYNDGRGKTFGVSDLDQLTRAHEKKLTELKNAQASLISFVKGHNKVDSVARPKVKFYAGTLGIKQAFRDMMWERGITETHMLWATRDMISIDEDFFKWHGTQRFKYDVFIYAIEKHEDRKIQGDKKHEWLKNDAKDNLVSVRYLPKNAKWKMNFWLYGNKCLFASGGAEKIAFTVHSKEFAETMKLLFDNLWENSKK
ncbi:MAG: winged helix-turn-helix domain-containing protein [Candidatus Paceibacterota bacterium]